MTCHRLPGTAALVVAAALAASGCSQPGTQVPMHQAAQLDVATNRVSVACGYAEELGAYGPAAPGAYAQPESIALSGAGKLAAVYDRDPSGLYQGESVGAIVQDSISLLHDCGLPRAEHALEHVLSAGGSRRDPP